ncbi:MAG TPA: dCTP deaminase [Thermoplasmataceae archaeon]|nr:dCTP deaminase [Thermoplasmatales archaeon AK]HLH86096.1 dCTP deaminase [Thermoplasmataceae archaeon]
MVVLRDSRILELCSSGNLIAENFSPESVTPNGYDLRVGKIRFGGAEGDEFTIPSNSHFLISTQEYLKMPATVMGQIWIRSSFSRKGILGSFGAVEAGYCGNLTLSFFNLSSETLVVTKGQRIAQIVFHELDGYPEMTYPERSGNYQGMRGINIKPKNE